MRASAPHRPFFNPSPLGLLAAAFACGVLLARALAPSAAACVACCAVFSALALSASLARRAEAYAAWLLVCAFACAGAALGVVESGPAAPSRVRGFYEGERIAAGEPVELTGVLERAPEWSPGGLRLTLRVERLSFRRDGRPASGRVELFAASPGADDSAGAGKDSSNVGEVPPGNEGGTEDESLAGGSPAREGYEALELRRGARVRVLASLGRGERYRNPGVSSFADYLERRGLDAAGTVKSPLLVERLDDEPVLLPLAWLDAARAWTVARVNRLFTRETAGVLNASLLGNREGLTRATGERFREGGTFHLLVISGLHVTFVGGAAWWLTGFLTRRHAWRFGASALPVWAYAVAVGAESSVVRAALMFTALALAPVLHRPAASLNALGGAALALLAWSPRGLFDPSFQLTFLSVLFIVAAAWPLLARLKETGEWRPTRATPHPPVCPAWWRALGESLFWSEKGWRRELSRATYSCRLFKTPAAARLEGWRVQRTLRYVFAALVVSACVQAGLLPLTVVYFHRFTLASLLLNLFAGALMAALSLVALAAVALSPAGEGLSRPLVWLAENLAWLTEHGVDPFASAGVAGLRPAEYAGAASLVYALYYLPLLLLLIALARWRPVPPADCFADENDGRNPEERGSDETGAATRTAERSKPTAVRRGLRRALLVAGQSPLFRTGRALTRFVQSRAALELSAAAFVLLFLAVLTHPFSAGPAAGRLRVDFLDVGQGDAALVTMPDGATLLVDGGGRPRWRDAGDDGAEFEPDRRGVGEAVVSEFLWRRGLVAVDYVLATHAHADHLRGLTDILNNFRVRAVLVARAPEADEEFARFARAARARGVSVYVISRGDALQFGPAVAEVLWPPPAPEPGGAPSGNDDSVVLRLRYGARSFLLAGDIERASESALLAAGEDLRADAVKVAHHGSRTSSTEEFVASVRPRVAVVSVGLDSPYGHPHPEVVRRWLASGARLLTTGRCGTVTLSTDGNDFKAATFVENDECGMKETMNAER